MSLSTQEIEHIFQKLRNGLVPERGLDAFAVGIERHRDELHRLMEMAERDEGLIKFLRGGYGCGKTFMSRLALLDAQRRGFATSFVVVSDNDLHFYKFDNVYNKIVENLSTPLCPRGALGDILDRWIGAVEEALIEGGANEGADNFDDLVLQRLGEELESKTRGTVPEDFVRVVRAVFEAKQDGEMAEANALLSWLSGSRNVAASSRKRAGVKGDVGSKVALSFLRGVTEIVKAADYKGLLIVIDEAETILRMRRNVRHKSLNGIRQIADAAGQYPGLIWLFTGTPEFFDTRRGVAGLEPLHDRVQFISRGGFTSSRQPQLALVPFDGPRLTEVALKLRELYPTSDRTRLEHKITPQFIKQLVDAAIAGFKGDVGVVPRQFLRAFVSHMDMVDEFPDYNPSLAEGFSVENVTEEEQYAAGLIDSHAVIDDDEQLVPVVDQW